VKVALEMHFVIHVTAPFVFSGRYLDRSFPRPQSLFNCKHPRSSYFFLVINVLLTSFACHHPVDTGHAFLLRASEQRIGPARRAARAFEAIV
jgi:hypothetical protein